MSAINQTPANDNYPTLNQYGFKKHNQDRFNRKNVILKAVSTNQSHYQPDSHSDNNKRTLGLYPYFILAVLFLLKIVMHWQIKSIGYFYGFKAVGDQIGSATYELSSAYPSLKQYYGLIVGLFQTVPNSVFGLIAGSIIS